MKSFVPAALILSVILVFTVAPVRAQDPNWLDNWFEIFANFGRPVKAVLPLDTTAADAAVIIVDQGEAATISLEVYPLAGYPAGIVYRIPVSGADALGRFQRAEAVFSNDPAQPHHLPNFKGVAVIRASGPVYVAVKPVVITP